MRAPATHTYRTTPTARQCGLTLVEMMVTIAIALFLLAGVGYMLQNTRKAYTSENQLSALQDSERLSMTLITDVVQSAGYFPDPNANTIDTALPVAAGPPVFASEQAITGTQVATAPEDDLSVRYMTTGSDGILTCLGTSNTAAAGTNNTTYTNVFSLSAADASGSRTLQCTLTDSTGAAAIGPLPLVNGLTNMEIWYGVKRSTTGTGNNVDTYLRANEMLTGGPNGNDWLNVTSVRIRLTFLNPLAAPTAPAAQKTVQIERVIAVMSRTGVST